MKITHPWYQDYPEQPYISPTRDLKAWELTPEKFPYQKVAKKQMIRTEEGLFPGDIVMLWRISFGNFSNMTVIPNYFEYRYGVDSDESIERLMDQHLIFVKDAIASLSTQNMTVLKRICDTYQLRKSGKRKDLENRITEHLNQHEIEEQFEERLYGITDAGLRILETYDAIIQEHGPKM